MSIFSFTVPSQIDHWNTSPFVLHNNRRRYRVWDPCAPHWCCAPRTLRMK